MKQLSLSQIDGSKQIQDWLGRFRGHREGAIEMLLRLRFFSNDEYASWLRKEIEQRLESPQAVFAVRKFEKKTKDTAVSLGLVWNEKGITVERPAQSQGSEDLVQSVVANIKKNACDTLLDHPSIEELRQKRVRDILLLDDSIGSGERVADYITRMLNDKHFKSWWNYGFIKIHVLAYARTVESEAQILSTIGGSNHHRRKFPISSKVVFHGYIRYARKSARERWGSAWQHVFDAARSASGVRRDRQLGFKKTMSNIVFYHSVPNNLPSALWFDSKTWSALLPQRTMPTWLIQLLEGDSTSSNARGAEKTSKESVNSEAVQILKTIKSGFRNESRIAWRVGLERRIVVELLVKLRSLGLVSLENRLTEAGFQYLKRQLPEQAEKRYNWELYVPSIWCAGRETVQPSGQGSLASLDQTESAEGSLDADGEVGQTSLEKTDAKTARPSLDVMTETPAPSWNGHDIHGPKG